MKSLLPLSTLVLAFLVVGCAGSRPPATPTASDPATGSPSAAPDTTTEASGTSLPAPSRAPRDWYHLDRVPRSGPGLNTRAAYQEVLQDRPPQDTVRVAVIDSGLDIDHEDLSSETWTNADEILGNGVDDDGNGYIDDVHGWNFIGGPDGENVNQDTYELTRIYVDLQERFDGVDSAAVAPDARDPYQRYQKIRRTFREKRREARNRLAQVGKAQKAVQASVDVLKTHLDTDSLTPSAVRSVTSPRQDVRRAQQTLQYFYDQDLSPTDLNDYKDQLERQVEYNYNPDFNPRSVVGDDYADKTGHQYGNADVEGPDPGHGTHVAGIIGAARENAIGVDGVARGVRLMSVRAVPNGDERDKDVANAIRYAADNGADVINMSFGKAYSPHKNVVDAAVQYADSMGVLMVHAAGNDGANVDSTDNFPSPYYANGNRAQRWIEVGASSWKGGEKLAAPFSNYGAERVDVFAPGQSIYSTVPDDAYERNDGTSMAAPMVSGLAALIMAHYPSLSATDVRAVILDTATPHRDQRVARPGDSESVPFGTLSDTGAIVNARAALQRAADRAAAQ
ncbi:S8 family peptidase [Salinibacter altiplanensis]|uniref:S8 family peptidase n=1 Tax=Salinibacter altiplanensis TaxID=1803181 RepID=UPI000C9F49AE|nr:S8 family peptidase [Salinibacter altiplanensis]